MAKEGVYFLFFFLLFFFFSIQLAAKRLGGAAFSRPVRRATGPQFHTQTCLSDFEAFSNREIGGATVFLKQIQTGFTKTRQSYSSNYNPGFGCSGWEGGGYGVTACFTSGFGRMMQSSREGGGWTKR